MTFEKIDIEKQKPKSVIAKEKQYPVGFHPTVAALSCLEKTARSNALNEVDLYLFDSDTLLGGKSPAHGSINSNGDTLPSIGSQSRAQALGSCASQTSDDESLMRKEMADKVKDLIQIMELSVIATQKEADEIKQLQTDYNNYMSAANSHNKSLSAAEQVHYGKLYVKVLQDLAALYGGKGSFSDPTKLAEVKAEMQGAQQALGKEEHWNSLNIIQRLSPINIDKYMNEWAIYDESGCHRISGLVGPYKNPTSVMNPQDVPGFLEWISTSMHDSIKRMHLVIDFLEVLLDIISSASSGKNGNENVNINAIAGLQALSNITSQMGIETQTENSDRSQSLSQQTVERLSQQIDQITQALNEQAKGEGHKGVLGFFEDLGKAVVDAVEDVVLTVVKLVEAGVDGIKGDKADAKKELESIKSMWKKYAIENAAGLSDLMDVVAGIFIVAALASGQGWMAAVMIGLLIAQKTGATQKLTDALSKHMPKWLADTIVIGAEVLLTMGAGAAGAALQDAVEEMVSSLESFGVGLSKAATEEAEAIGVSVASKAATEVESDIKTVIDDVNKQVINGVGKGLKRAEQKALARIATNTATEKYMTAMGCKAARAVIDGPIGLGLEDADVALIGDTVAKTIADIALSANESLDDNVVAIVKKTAALAAKEMGASEELATEIGDAAEGSVQKIIQAQAALVAAQSSAQQGSNAVNQSSKSFDRQSLKAAARSALIPSAIIGAGSAISSTNLLLDIVQEAFKKEGKKQWLEVSAEIMSSLIGMGAMLYAGSGSANMGKLIQTLCMAGAISGAAAQAGEAGSEIVKSEITKQVSENQANVIGYNAVLDIVSEIAQSSAKQIKQIIDGQAAMTKALGDAITGGWVGANEIAMRA